jgi:hypothetical protein
MLEFQVRKADFVDTRIIEAEAAPLAPGAARLRIDLFALTSNNITYAAMGDGELGYWDFFPAPEGWGRPPCWGFATVEASNAEHVANRARVYGYFPIGTHLDVMVTNATAVGFTDGTPHRSGKAAVYNRYLLTEADPAYDPDREAEQALFRPLYATGWWAADYIHLGNPTPRTVVFSSASAKTALATAHQLKRLGVAGLVGLTSARHREYVIATGLYSTVVAYDELASVGAAAPACYVDFLGRDELTQAVHRALGSALHRSVMIGATDWTAKPGGIRIPEAPANGVRSEFLFVPSHAAGRIRTEGPTLGARMACDLRAFYSASNAFVKPRKLCGAEAVRDSWRRLLDGAVPPDEGLVHAW